MKNYLMSIGLDGSALVLQEYKVPKVIPSETEDKKKFREIQRQTAFQML